jgi:hypothetical protein
MWGMTRLAVIVALCATPAIAGFERMRLLPGEGPCFALVSIENRMGRYSAVETLETDHGPVSISYETIGNHNATDHDLVDVVDLPPGVAANPMHIDLPDGDTGYVCLMEYLGN